MSREIKVRCFYTGDGESELIYSDSYQGITEGDRLAEFFADCFGCEYELYTGLKDKNGVEIYEGDIVTFLNKDAYPWTIHFEVGFYEGAFSLINVYPNKPISKAMRDYCLCDGEPGSNLEIKGNIHQNPELFKGEQA